MTNISSPGILEIIKGIPLLCHFTDVEAEAEMLSNLLKVKWQRCVLNSGRLLTE